MTRHIADLRNARRLIAVRADGGGGPKEIYDELKTAFEAFKAEHTKQLDELAKGYADVVQAEQVDRINAEITKLQGALDKTNEQLAAAAVGALPASNPDAAAYTQAFDRFFRGGVEASLGELAVKASLSTSSDPDGGFVVPSEMETAIDRVLENISAMRSIATVRTISASSFKKLITTTGVEAGWVGEKDTRSETETPKLSGLEFPTFELYANPAASQTLLDDASVSIEQWLADEVTMEFAEQEGNAFILGDGKNKPHGLLSYDTVANVNWVWGKLGFIVSGAAADFAASDPSDQFLDLIYGLRSGFRQGASWLMNDLTTAKVRQFKDGSGNYLWQPSAQAGQPASLMGYAHRTDDWMPDVGANAFPVAFGDFRRGYVIIDRIGIRVIRDNLTNKPYVHFYTTKRLGGGVQNYQAIKLLKIST